MLANTKVLITGIIMGGVVILALVGSLAYLAARNADATTVLSLVSMLLSAVTLARTYAIGATVNQVKEQTNGALTKLTDAAIAAPPQKLAP